MLKEILSPNQILLHYFFFRIGLQIKGHTSVLSAYSLVIACEESSCFLFWWLVFHIFVPSVNIWERKKDFSSCPYDLMSDAWIFENGFFGWTVPKEAWILSGTNFPPLEIGYRMLDTREKAINILTIQIRNNWSLRKHHLKLVEGRNQMKLNERDESWSGLWKISRIWRYSASISTNTYFLTSFVVDVNTSFLTQVGSSIKEMVRSSYGVRTWWSGNTRAGIMCELSLEKRSLLDESRRKTFQTIKTT